MGSGVERPPRSGRSGRGNRSHHESLAGDQGRLLALGWMVIKSGRPWDVELGGLRVGPLAPFSGIGGSNLPGGEVGDCHEL